MSAILLGMLQFDSSTLSELNSSLARISEILDHHEKEVFSFAWTIPDFTWGNKHTLPLLSVIKLAIYMVIKRLTYRELEDATKCDLSLRLFARISDRTRICKSTLQNAISTLPKEIISKVNQLLCSKYEDLTAIIVDSTGVSANIALPENNNLLYQALRRAQKIMDRIEKKAGKSVFSYWIDVAEAKRLSYDIRFDTKNSDEKDEKYKILLLSAGQLQDAAPAIIEEANSFIDQVNDPSKTALITKLVDEFLFHIEKMSCLIYQTIAWIQGEKLAPSDKIFSMAKDMDHTDIIIKDNRKIVYGHKIDVTQGPRGLITHLVIYSGNPNDASNLIDTVELLETIFETKIITLAADGGYNSIKNLEALRKLGVKECVFTRKRALSIEDMGVSADRYQELKNWRSRIEGGIGRLKKRFGFTKVICTTFKRFELRLWIGVLAANVCRIAAKPTIFALN